MSKTIKNRSALARTAALGFSLLLTALATTSPAHAQRNIGSAVSIEREVSASLGGRTRTLSSGNGVLSNDNIRTANASAAQLQFLDQSKLRIGPSASVVLDRFVFNPDQTAREGTVNVGKGAARWVSGTSKPGTHKVTTPHAVIGVRGTVFDVLVEARRTIVTLREGVIVVCPIAAQRNCVTLNAPGQTVIVTTTTIEGPFRNGPSETRFGDLCLSPIDSASCVFTRTADLGPDPRWDGIYGGVHGGYSSNRSTVVTDGSFNVRDSINLGNVPTDLATRSQVGMGGVQAGYLWQTGPAVFGVEVDFSVINATASQSITRNTGFGFLVTTTAQQNVDFLTTLRGRAGIAFDNVLVFGTGGLAVGQINLSGSIIPTPFAPTYIGNRTLVKAGYVYGGGVEVAVGWGATIRAEYLHYDLGSDTIGLNEVTGTSPGDFGLLTFHSRGDIGRAALNFKF